MAWWLQNDPDHQAIQNQQDSLNSLAKVVMDNWTALIICWQNSEAFVLLPTTLVYISIIQVKTKEHPCPGGMITDYIPAVSTPHDSFFFL